MGYKGAVHRALICVGYCLFGGAHGDGKDGGSGRAVGADGGVSEVPDPHVEGRSKYDLVEMLVISVGAMVCGIEDFVGIESWSKERVERLRRFLMLEGELFEFQWVPMSLTRAPRSGPGLTKIPTLTPPQGGEVLSAGRARGQAPHGALPQALERTGGRWRIKGSLRQATPAMIRHQPLTLCA